MLKISLVCFLVFLSTSAPSATYTAVNFEKHESHLIVPYPMKLSAIQIVKMETRKLIHFLKRAFVGVSANYSTGPSYSNYGPVIGIQLPSRIGLRLWGGLSQGRTMDMQKDYIMDSKASGFNGHRVGMGIKLKGDLNLDLEYQTIDGQQSARNNSYLMSLSVPLNL